MGWSKNPRKVLKTKNQENPTMENSSKKKIEQERKNGLFGKVETGEDVIRNSEGRGGRKRSGRKRDREGHSCTKFHE